MERDPSDFDPRDEKEPDSEGCAYCGDDDHTESECPDLADDAEEEFNRQDADRDE